MRSSLVSSRRRDRLGPLGRAVIDTSRRIKRSERPYGVTATSDGVLVELPLRHRPVAEHREDWPG
jgi:hypothetical protein